MASCLQWSPDTGTWEELLTLDVWRYGHVSWAPGNGNVTYLMGGSASEMWGTSTLIKSDGTQEPGFELKYDTRWVPYDFRLIYRYLVCTL